MRCTRSLRDAARRQRCFRAGAPAVLVTLLALAGLPPGAPAADPHVAARAAADLGTPAPAVPLDRLPGLGRPVVPATPTPGGTSEFGALHPGRWQGGRPPQAPAAPAAHPGVCDPPLGGPDGGPRERESLLENLSVFGGLDGSKGPEDLGVNAHFGVRGHVNWGLPLLEEVGLGVQVGTGLNFHNNAVRVLKSVLGVTDRTQSFTTVGLFQRTGFGLSWGVVYDFLSQDYYAGLDLGQWRGQVGYQLGDRDEVGVWAAVRGYGDSAVVAGETLRLRPITQGNLYWRHVWESEAVTRFWVGLAESHGRFLLVAPGEGPVDHPFVFGADLLVPLNDRLALFGEANFITPNDTGTVTATLGVAFYPGGGARRAASNRFAPLLPVANNPTFAVDLRR